MTQIEEQYLETFSKKVHTAVFGLLREKGKIDERMPDMPDIEEKWSGVATAYIPDGVREFNGYPLVSLGWVMYVGMAVAHLWDKDWERFAEREDLYAMLRDKRGYDCMDEYIREEILHLSAAEYKEAEQLCGTCAQTVYNMIMHEHIEPSTPMAFQAYVKCIHVLYTMGAAVELLRLGYKMTPIGV